MPRRHRTRYDTYEVPSGPELKAMYLSEGLSEEEAAKKAEMMHTYLDNSRKAEQRFWTRVRANEETVGLDIDGFIAGEDVYAS